MRKWQIGFMAEEAGMHAALRKWARDQAESLQLAKASGELAEPVLWPLGQEVKRGARWTDDYPAWQVYADELEKLLAFAQSKGRFDSYLARLRGSDSQRDSALMELRVARHLEACGFEVVEWDPKGLGTGTGEFLVEGRVPVGRVR